MREFPYCCILALSISFATPSKAQGKIELFGGYSFVHAPVTLTETVGTCTLNCPTLAVGTHLNLNGWEASGAYKLFGTLSLTADFSGHYASFNGASVHLHTYLFGPQVRFPRRVSPFARVLFGAAHEANGIGNFGPVFTRGGSENSFATALGVGIDIKVLPSISVRPIQFDYLLTRFRSTTQNQPRVSAGVVVHF